MTLCCLRSTLWRLIGAHLIIRPAQDSDVGRVYELCEMAFCEMQPKAKFSPVVVRLSIARLMSDGFLIVAEDQGEVIGLVSGGLTSHAFSDELVSMNVLFYVVPAFRGSTAMVRLADAYVDWAEAQGVSKDNTFISVMGGTDQAFVDYGFKRAGYLLSLGG